MLPLNVLQDGTPYDGRPVCNSPEFMPLYNLLNRDILHPFHIHSVLICYILDGERTEEENITMRFSYSTPREIARGLKRLWDSQMGGTPSSARITEDFDRGLEALEIVLRENGAAVEVNAQ